MSDENKKVTVIGLCGRTGSGKSTVGKYFRSFGALYIDTDTVSREITAPGSDCLRELTERFGNGIITPEGRLDRSALAAIAMADEAGYLALNLITHAHILAETRKRIAACDVGCVVVDAPLLFESGLDADCDFTVGVISDESLCLRRASERDGVTAETVSKRLARQKSNDFLMRHCDIIIENNSTESALYERAAAVYAELSGRHSRG